MDTKPWAFDNPPAEADLALASPLGTRHGYGAVIRATTCYHWLPSPKRRISADEQCRHGGAAMRSPTPPPASTGSSLGTAPLYAARRPVTAGEGICHRPRRARACAQGQDARREFAAGAIDDALRRRIAMGRRGAARCGRPPAGHRLTAAEETGRGWAGHGARAHRPDQPSSMICSRTGAPRAPRAPGWACTHSRPRNT
jgi:hypothetical protein